MKRYGLIFAVFCALCCSVFAGDFFRLIVKALPTPDIPWATSIIMNLIDVVLMCGFALVFGAKHTELWRASGIATPIFGPMLMAVIALTLPTMCALPFLRPSPEFGMGDFLWLALGSPFIEEIVFRGLALGILIRLSGVPFSVAIGFPALMFGLGHFANGESLADALSIVAVTGLGGLLFGWLYLRWGGSIWPPFFMHAGLNGLFELFAIGDDATLGLVGNILRTAVVVIAIAISLWGIGFLSRCVGVVPPNDLLAKPKASTN